ncbi:MAG: hypothetical protein WBC11_08950 [Dehalococcoidia bacterium]
MGLARWARLALDRSGTAFGALFAGVDGDSLLEDDPVGEFLSHKKDGAFQLEDEEGGGEAQASLEPRVTKAEGGDTEALEPAAADLEQSPEEQELEAEDLGLMSLDEDEEGAVELEEEVEEVAAATDEALRFLEDESEEAGETTDDGLRVLQVEGETVEMAAVADDEPRVVEAENRGIEAPASGGNDPRTLDTEGQEVAVAELSDDDLEAVEEKEQKVEIAGSPQVGKAQGDEEDSLLEVFKSEPLAENPISVLAQGLEDTNIYSLLEEMKAITDKVRKSS